MDGLTWEIGDIKSNQHELIQPVCSHKEFKGQGTKLVTMTVSL